MGRYFIIHIIEIVVKLLLNSFFDYSSIVKYREYFYSIYRDLKESEESFNSSRFGI